MEVKSGETYNIKAKEKETSVVAQVVAQVLGEVEQGKQAFHFDDGGRHLGMGCMGMRDRESRILVGKHIERLEVGKMDTRSRICRIRKIVVVCSDTES